MDTFFTILKKSLVATTFVMFALAATYVPQPSTPQAQAGSIIGATFPQQVLDAIQQSYNNISAAASKAFDAIDGYLDKLDWQKDWLLDGLAWTVAKAIVGAMVQDLISWVNSGFEGAPMFITDMKGFLLDVGDDLAGEYIANLGDFGSFICSPFRLDIQIAVALNYQKIRNADEPERCTLTGIKGNLENFIDGTQRSFENGGWTNWLEITAKPEQYTPYGSTLNAVAVLNARLVNDKGAERTASPDGFMSQKDCKMVTAPVIPVGPGTMGPPPPPPKPKEECTVTTPGKVISEMLSKNVDSDREALISADEVNEIFAAIVGQIGKAAVGKANSLLGGF